MNIFSSIVLNTHMYARLQFADMLARMYCVLYCFVDYVPEEEPHGLNSRRQLRRAVLYIMALKSVLMCVNTEIAMCVRSVCECVCVYVLFPYCNVRVLVSVAVSCGSLRVICEKVFKRQSHMSPCAYVSEVPVATAAHLQHFRSSQRTRSDCSSCKVSLNGYQCPTDQNHRHFALCQFRQRTLVCSAEQDNCGIYHLPHIKYVMCVDFNT